VSKFIIEPHRLGMVAEEKGYFRLEGLEYEFRERTPSTDGATTRQSASGAFQASRGREST
jgi:hypothetical protein